MPRIRLAAAITTAAAIALAVLSPTAHADAGSLQTGLNQIRAEAGLAAVADAPESADGAARGAAGRGLLWSSDPARQVSQRVLSTSEDPLSVLRRDPTSLGMILDPRTVGMSAAQGNGLIALAVVRDLRSPFPAGRLVVWPSRWDPSAEQRLVVVGAGSASLGRLDLIDHLGRAIPGVTASDSSDGEIQVTMIRAARGSEVPFGRTLSVHGPRGRAQVQTTPAPAIYGGPLRIKGAALRKAKLIRRTINAGPPVLRNLILPSLRGSATIVGPRPSLCGGQRISCFYDDAADPVISLARNATDGTRGGRFVILHELGHLVAARGLTRADMAEFSRMLRASRAYRCLPNPLKAAEAGKRPCVGDEEWFADEFARWAMRNRDMSSGYDTPAALSKNAFVRFLRARFAVHT